MDSPQIYNIGLVNWLGLWTLYKKEVQRFMKVYTQTIIAPVITTMLYVIIFSLALGGLDRIVGDTPFVVFLMPGLIMMSMAQNAFANTSSSIMISKYDGSIVDILMPPLSAFELTFAKVMGGTTRGLVVGLSTGIAGYLFIDADIHSFTIIFIFSLLGSMMLSTLGVIGGIWAEKFDHIAALTNFIIMPLTFLSGTFYTVERLPEKWQLITHFNPFFYMIDGFRYGFIGRADSDISMGIIILLGVNASLLGLCWLLIVKGYKIKS